MMDSSLLLSRAEDAVRLCDVRNYPHFLGFLDQSEQAAITRHLKRTDQSFLFYGGHKDAERCFLGVFPSYMETDLSLFPLEAVAFHYRKERALTHRDVLGTLMSQGLRREAVGDILCGEGCAVVYLKEEVSPYIGDQVDKIGGEGVRVERHYTGVLPESHGYAPLSDTIASARLDAVVKALIHGSREQAASLIRSQQVSVDHRPILSLSATVSEGSVISVRGCGRFVIDRIGPETKKGRLHFAARKYI